MAFTPSIQQLGASHVQAQSAYQQSVYNANALMVGISSSDLPALNVVPSNWSEFVSTYEAAKSEAQAWFDDVSDSLLDVPEDVTNYNAVISQLLSVLSAEAQQLQANPQDTNTLNSFNSNLTNLSQTFDIVQTFIAGAVNQVEQFNNTLPQLAANLQTLTNDFSQQVNADQAAITQLQQSVNALNADMASLAAKIAAEGIALDAAIVIARFTPAWWPSTIALKLIATVAVAALTYCIATDTAQIATDLANIKTATDQITGDTADVAACQLQVTAFSNFTAGVSSVQSDLQNVLNAWTQLKSEIDAAVADAGAAAKDASSSNFAAVVQDLAAASNEWATTYSQAGSLQVTLAVNTAVLNYGMSAGQTQQALASGTTTSIQSFVNSAQSSA